MEIGSWVLIQLQELFFMRDRYIKEEAFRQPNEIATQQKDARYPCP